MNKTKAEKVDAYIRQLATRAGRKPTTELLAMCGKVALEGLSSGPNLTRADKLELGRRVRVYYSDESVSNRLFPNRRFNKIN